MPRFIEFSSIWMCQVWISGVIHTSWILK